MSIQTGRIHSEYITDQHTRTGAASAAKTGQKPSDVRSQKAAYDAADGFVHTEASSGLYTDYTSQGHYADDDGRVLPPRYYDGRISGNVFYKGGTISYLNLLEEAVQSGAVVLDESKSMWANVENAHHALIEAKAVQPYPGVSSMYSEDGQYRFRVENGQITGATAAFYTDSKGRKITAQYLAEQLAAGVPPTELDGDWSFLAHLDNELYTKALETGNAKRSFEQLQTQYTNGEITEDEYLDAIHPFLLYFLGRDDGHAGAKLLKELMLGPDFGKHVLEGSLETANRANSAE